MSQLTEQLQISHEFWQLCGGMVNVSCCIRHPKLINQKVVLEKKAKKNLTKVSKQIVCNITAALASSSE